MSKPRLSRIQSAERKLSYQTVFAPPPTEEEKAKKLQQLREREKGFWRSVRQFVVSPQHS